MDNDKSKVQLLWFYIQLLLYLSFMDKNMSRKILFDKKAPSQPAEKPKKQVKETEKPKPEPTKQPEIEFQPDSSLNAALKPISWINSHPEFKWSAMCLKIGLDKSNFKRVLDAENPVLRSEQVEKIENFLKDYGYANLPLVPLLS